jgi:hypothetical protein
VGFSGAETSHAWPITFGGVCGRAAAVRESMGAFLLGVLKRCYSKRPDMTRDTRRERLPG